MLGKSLIKAASGNAGIVPVDDNFSDTTLLLQADDVNDGSQNNTFLDSSTNTHTITRNGNVTQGSFSPFSQDEGKWGNYFDGSGDELTAANDAGYSFGSGDFTVEMWVNSTQTSVAGILTHASSGGATNTNWGLYLNIPTSNKVGLYVSDGSTYQVIIDSTTSVNDGSWHHIAATREGDTFRLFVDGNLEETATWSGSISSTSRPLRVGSNNASFYEGYISNARIVKGTALYTSNFTPSTTPLTDITNTSLLTCQSNRFVDNSSNAHAITVNGDPEVTPFSPFAPSTAYNPATKGGSGYFEDGDTDLLSLADSTDFDIYGGDYTVEAWLYATRFATFNFFLSKGHSLTREWGFRFTSSNVTAYWSTNGSGSGDQTITASTTNNLNEWFHLAFVKSGNTITIYKNGTSIGSGSFTSIYSGSDPLYISRFMNFTTIDHSHDGYIAHLRIVKGTAIAPSGIPTSPPTAVTNTSLLCNFTNAGIYDGTGRNVLETVADAHVENAVKKYGTGSMQFDGTGDYLRVAPSSLLYFGTGDFTIECWINTTVKSSDGGDRRIFKLHGPSSSAANQIQLLIDAASGVIRFYSNSYILTGTTAVDDGVWHHVALVRNSGTSALYIDGSSEDTAADTTDYNVSTEPSPNIGSFNGTAGDWNGYIDDFRITKGVARYTANFTPPAAKLPNL